jgi:hypothetical protein
VTDLLPAGGRFDGLLQIMAVHLANDVARLRGEV